MEYWARSEALALCWNNGIMGYEIFNENVFFSFSYPIFQHSTIPSFHVAYKKIATKRTQNPIDCNISRCLIDEGD